MRFVSREQICLVESRLKFLFFMRQRYPQIMRSNTDYVEKFYSLNAVVVFQSVMS